MSSPAPQDQATDISLPRADAHPDGARRRPPMAVIGGILVMLGVGLGFLISNPTMIGPDEPFHIDRVIAAAHGDLIQEAGTLHRSQGGMQAERDFIHTWMKRNGKSQAEFEPLPRERASLNDLGGNVRKSGSILNYLTQHPPLYYDLMGAAMWALPGADDLPFDQVVLYLRAWNVVLVSSLPIFFWLAAKELFGRRNPITAAAAFLPPLIVGIPHLAATVNNDNLGVVFGAAIVWLSLRVMRGDTSVRTAIWLAAVCVLGSLTKLTVITLAILVVVAYVTRWVRDRRPPPTGTIVVMCIGGVLSLAWWLKNLVKFGNLIPADAAWGPRRSQGVAVPRPPEKPPLYDQFWDYIARNLPKRIWSSLGLHEPPELPNLLVLALTIASVLALIISILVVRGVRWEIVCAAGMFALLTAMMITSSLSHFSKYVGYAGIQGRYVWPTAIGLLLPIAIAINAALKRWNRWTPLVVAVLATTISGWGLYLAVEYTWLHRFETLTPGNLGRAIATLAGHFPLAPPGAQILIILATVIWLGGLVIAVLCCRPLAPRSVAHGHSPLSEDVPTAVFAVGTEAGIGTDSATTGNTTPSAPPGEALNDTDSTDAPGRASS